MKEILYRRAAVFRTPFGEAVAIVDGRDRLIQLTFARGVEERVKALGGIEPAAKIREVSSLAAVSQQLLEYASGQRRVFDIALGAEGTPFQMTVWRALVDIPFGTTIPYGILAERIGSAGSARAVGGASAVNPIALIVPCHRVIGSDGELTGYAGGLPLKQKLLRFEERVAGTAPQLSFTLD